MATLDELREGVRRSLAPELAEIRDAGLRDRVVDAWALALAETEFGRIEDIPGSSVPDAPPMARGTQVEHLRGVTRMALALVDQLEGMVGPLGINRDLLIAAALCHDVGKPYEYSPRNRARWKANPKAAGFPAIRHPVYGVHVALLAGLPEAVVHAAGAHSAEGENVQRSLENTIVHHADMAFWGILRRAGALQEG